MALITRVSRLFRADVNAVLDRMEEPEILLRQAVREMEEEVDREAQRARLIGLELKQIAGRQADLEGRLKEIAEELALCLSSGNEPLARVLLKRRLETERFLKFLLRKRGEQQTAADELATRITEHGARLEAMRQKVEVLVGQDRDEACAASWAEPDFARQFSVSDDDVELALLREKQKRVQP
jgi:phage shock protein A